MNAHETTTVYPLWVEKNEDFPDPIATFKNYDSSGYDPNGADLFVASYSERLAYALGLQQQAGQYTGKYGEGMKVEAESLLKTLESEAKMAHDELKERLELLSEQDKLYARAVQDWTMTALERRIEARGYDYDQSDVRTHLETIDVLDDLIDELSKDVEDEKLIVLASTWRNEVAAEVTMHTIQDAYRLAA